MENVANAQPEQQSVNLFPTEQEEQEFAQAVRDVLNGLGRPYHYKSRIQEDVRRYAVSGILVPFKGQIFLVVAYAITSERDQFTKKKGHLISEGRLRSESYIVIPVNPEEDQTGLSVFLNFVRKNAPLAVAPFPIQLHFLSQMYEQVVEQEGQEVADKYPFSAMSMIVPLPEPRQKETEEDAQAFLNATNPEVQD